MLPLTAGCANYAQEKIQEWEQAYEAGEISYYEKEQLKVLQRQVGGLSSRYYHRSHPAPHHPTIHEEL